MMLILFIIVGERTNQICTYFCTVFCMLILLCSVSDFWTLLPKFLIKTWSILKCSFLSLLLKKRRRYIIGLVSNVFDSLNLF